MDAPTEVRGVLFDFGNTLFAHAPLALTIQAAAGKLGLQIDEDDLVTIAYRIDAASMTPDELAFGRDLDTTVWNKRWQVLYGMADEWGKGLGEAINASMHAPSEWIPYPRAASTLHALHERGIAIGIVSNTGWDVRAVFAEHDMADAVTSFTLSYEAGCVKPDQRIFDAACRSLALSTDKVVMVGDDPRADSGAVRVGIRTLLVPALPPRIDNGIGEVLKLVVPDH
ncbi:MAG TPA: HAD-IA family hydrolase [Ilumatobacteraceae bacterium]